MIKSLLSIVILIFFSSCTSKKTKALLQSYQKNKNYHNLLQKTEKVLLKDANMTKVLLTATYIYNAKKKDKDEVFIIGFYNEESEVQSFNQSGFSLTLNGKKEKSIKVLKKENPLLKDISFVSQWSSFFLVHFPHTSKKSFNLVLKSDLYGNGSLHFAKVAKYIFTKEAFK